MIWYRGTKKRCWRYGAAGSLACIGALACAGEGNVVVDPISGDPGAFVWQLPTGFPQPTVPTDNPMSAAKVELGRRLFYDTRLSVNGAFACASCHRQADAFADAKNVPVGTTGQAHTRNSMALANVAYFSSFGWGDPRTRALESQALIPMFGDSPVELGLKGSEPEFIARLRTVREYQQLFPKSFSADSDPFSVRNVTRALAAFQRTLVSGDSPFDRFRRGDASAISESARRGEAVFRSPRTRCAECHGGLLFSNAAFVTQGSTASTVNGPEFVNDGLYNLGGTGRYPDRNGGLFETTGILSDMGKMKIPSLRNVGLTFPYMHDGSLSTLDDVVSHYARGGRSITIGPNAGDGSTNPFKDRRVQGFALTPAERADLVAFLRALTDSTFVNATRFSNPWR